MPKSTKIARRSSGASNANRARLERVKALGKRATGRLRAEAEKQEDVLTAAAAAYALGHAKKEKWNLPTIAGIEPALLYGGALALAGPRLLSGRAARMMQAAGTGLLTVGAYTYARTGSASIGAADVPNPPMRNGYHESATDDDVEIDD